MWGFLRKFFPQPITTEALPEFLSATVTTLCERFDRAQVEHAIVGGVAIALLGPPRVTTDLDFLVSGKDKEKAHEVMQRAGFEAHQSTAAFANYHLGQLQVDFLFATGPIKQEMLRAAATITFRERPLRLVQPEDLIGLKLQALANAPDRANDWSDIQTLFAGYENTMDLARLREYFVLFGRENDFEELTALHRRRKG